MPDGREGAQAVAQHRVSVVIPCHNYGRYLEQCVSSVLSQEGVSLDVLIVDDTSTDDSWQVAQKLAAMDSRVVCRRNDVNLGMVGTINEALWAVDGDYLVKLDADDLLTPGSLKRSAELLAAHPEVAFVYGRPIQFFGDEPPPARTKVTGWKIWPGHDWARTRCRRAVNCINQPEVMMRRSALHEAGPYRPELPHTSDFEMWLRLAATGDVGWIQGPDQGWMRVHSQSMQQTVNSGHVKNLQQRQAAFEFFFAGRGQSLRDAQALHAVTRRQLAVEALGLACSAYKRGLPDSEPVDEYIAFAMQIYPGYESLRPWRELGLRRRLTGGRALAHPTLLLGAATRRGEKVLAHHMMRTADGGW